jgi:flagellar hook protein FlgE
MLESIYIGLTGLTGYSQGLKVISNNVTNLNTPGFKSSQLQFADMFYSTQGAGGGQNGTLQFGTGLTTLGTVFDFSQGEIRQTGNDLDVAVEGNGLFVLRNKAGELRFSRAGQFGFDAEGFLVSRSGGSRVLALGAEGELHEVSLQGLRLNPPKATSSVKFTGNLNSSVAQNVVDSVRVIDAVGGEHLLRLTFGNNSAATPGEWTVSVAEGATSVGSGTIRFNNGQPVPGASTFSVDYTPAGAAQPASLSFDFSADTTSFASGTTSTLEVASQDGFAVGALSKVSFDGEGHLVLTYSNGQETRSQRLALASFERPDATLAEVGGNEFALEGATPLRLGHAATGPFGSISAGVVEISNVDLSQQFSDLIIAQRGYQASSQVIGTANELLQALFELGKR